MEIRQYTYKNKEEINYINVRDMYFADINVRLDNKKICIILESTYLQNKSYNMFFENVIHFECSRLDLFETKENKLLEIYLNEENSIKKYIDDKVKKEQEKCYPTPIEFIQDTEKFISICILTNTGDVTNIVCEKMILMG